MDSEQDAKIAVWSAAPSSARKRPVSSPSANKLRMDTMPPPADPLALSIELITVAEFLANYGYKTNPNYFYSLTWLATSLRTVQYGSGSGSDPILPPAHQRIACTA